MARKNEVTELSDDSAEGPAAPAPSRKELKPPATPEASVKTGPASPDASVSAPARPATASKSKAAPPASPTSPEAKAKGSPKATAKSCPKAKAKISPKAKAKTGAKAKAKGKAKAKAKTGASRRATEQAVESDGAEPVASMRRPAAHAEQDSVPEEAEEAEQEEAEQAEDVEEAPTMKRPAARRGFKRPAAEELKPRAYKYMYHKKQMWGIKLRTKEVMQAVKPLTALEHLRSRKLASVCGESFNNFRFCFASNGIGCQIKQNEHVSPEKQMEVAV